LLAYSSIAHVGYMLLALVAMGTSPVGSPGFNDGFKGILIYLLVYTFMNLGAFAVITSLRQRNVIGDEIDDMAGLYQRAPVEAMLMLLFLLSLAGIPPAAGFLGKYYIFLSLIESGHYGLACARRSLLAVWTLLLPEDCELHADARPDRDRATARQRRHALRGGHHGAGHDHDRNLSGAVHSRRELVAGDRAASAYCRPGEVGLRANQRELIYNSFACLSLSDPAEKTPPKPDRLALLAIPRWGS
jgi:hypothetical protein